MSKRRAPQGAPRYRWTRIGCVQAWFSVDDLSRQKQIGGAGVVRYLPPMRFVVGYWANSHSELRENKLRAPVA